MFIRKQPTTGDAAATIGGGTKKVLYTLQTAQRIGLKNTAKALTSHNTCKACGLGMGGQRGGMRNELDEFPSVCNKSVQAQETDIQPPIPAAVFEHSLAELRELTGHELEHLGRLGTPLYKSAASDRYTPLDWDAALAIAVERFRQTDPHRAFFYSSGRSSNEAGFVLQLFARLFGTNNVNNCSYYCHQATGVALENTIGTGTATVELADLKACDLIFVIGANPSSNHPRFIHQLKACRDRGGDVIVINPAREPGLVRFAVPKSPASLIAGGSWIASDYLQPKIGTDVALFKGIAKALLESGDVDTQYTGQHTSGFAEFGRDIQGTAWTEIVALCGVSQADIQRVAKTYAQAEHVVFAWGMGMTHHRNGVHNIEQISNLALLRGMVGRPCAGLLPLRGHSNVQGIGTIGVKPVLAKDVFRNIEEHLQIKLPQAPGMDTMASMQAAAAGEIDLSLLMGGNLFGSNPDAAWAARALNRIRTKIFLTTTLNRGHVTGMDDGEALVLPVTARDEEWQPTTQESMFNYVRMSDGGIDRLDNVRPEVTILCDIACSVLRDHTVDFAAFKNHRTIREAIAATIPGMEELGDIDVARREFHIKRRIRHLPEFDTADRKAHFVVRELPQTTLQEGQFTLSTIRSEGQFNTIIYEERDSYRGTTDRWVILMNKTDMANLNVNEGDPLTIASHQGRMVGLKAHGFDIPAGNMMAYFPEANVLTSQAVDPLSKTPAFKSTPVWIEATRPPLRAPAH